MSLIVVNVILVIVGVLCFVFILILILYYSDYFQNEHFMSNKVSTLKKFRYIDEPVYDSVEINKEFTQKPESTDKFMKIELKASEKIEKSSCQLCGSKREREGYYCYFCGCKFEEIQKSDYNS